MDHENPVFRSLELIEKRISEKLTVENIANSVHFSKYHYQRLFSEIVGAGVMEYVTKRKLTLAGKALLETDANIIDIALDYGYDSREGFTRSFKSYMGVSPTEYRKYGLTAISQKTVKERSTMTYSKITDEIIRELNDFIVKAKDVAKFIRKCELPWYKEFWCSIADRTDSLTDQINRTLTRVADIADCPDQITNRFNIIKILDDKAFALHIMVFHVEVTTARANPEDRKALQPYREKYLTLGASLTGKIHKTAQFLNELSALIIEDMRKTFASKMDEIVRRARTAADQIEGYGYIKHELTCMADELAAIPVSEVTAKILDDTLFKLPFLQLSIETDILRSGGKDKPMFDGIEPLRQSLEDAYDFIKSLPEPRAEEPLVVSVAKTLDDIGYQGNILLFYARGEAEKLGALLNERQKVAFERTCQKISHYIKFTQNSADETAFQPIADRIFIIAAEMTELVNELGENGGSLRVISDTFVALNKKVVQCIKSVEQKHKQAVQTEHQLPLPH